MAPGLFTGKMQGFKKKLRQGICPCRSLYACLSIIRSMKVWLKFVHDLPDENSSYT